MILFVTLGMYISVSVGFKQPGFSLLAGCLAWDQHPQLNTTDKILRIPLKMFWVFVETCMHIDLRQVRRAVLLLFASSMAILGIISRMFPHTAPWGYM
jgi:hypothetical protein